MSSKPHHKIVCLDACYCAIPSFSVLQHEYVEYENTPADRVAERIKDATIVITTRVPMTEATIEQCQRLEHITVMAAGIEIVDLNACKRRGITVSRIPSASAEAVAEHAIMLYLAAKRRLVRLHQLTIEGETWPKKGSSIDEFGGLPRPCSQETMGIIGYGNLGKRVESMAKALGTTVLIAERKNAPDDQIRPGRTSFREVLLRSDVIIIGIPLDDSSRGLIGHEELSLMNEHAVLINVSRGGVVDEVALVQALREGWIGGAATDVFSREPAKKGQNALLDPSIPNLIVTPHVAWYASSSIQNLQETVKLNVESYVQGKPQNLVIF